ncbi:unnamed protein product [Euphydryas editha]|uniref:Major facilitator superfamily (MFS) profile domain-containing protein n=1 Tax=Euphydryas editha TaxID=104508 RepID=A0AAU9UIU8_EUPED|nr:unnamed protein product [Euphydryas editha]
MVLRKKTEKEKSEIALKRGHTYYQWIFSLLAGCTHLVYGLECGWMSPTAEKLQGENSPSGYPLSDEEIAWVASSMSTAATCVVIIHSYISDRYGRKINIIILAFLGALSWVIRIFYNSFICLILARVCAGMVAGGCYTVVLMYIKEISQDDMRGILCALTTIFQSLGIFMMYLIGVYLDYYSVIYVIVSIPIMTMLGMILAPESPEILIKQGKIDKAMKTVAFMRGLNKDDQIVQAVVETMMKEAEKFKSMPDLTILSILKNKIWRRGFVLIMITFTFFEMNGAFAIITFASMILTSTGIEFVISPELLALSFPVVMVLASLALASCVERYGRKLLLIGAYVVSCCCMFGMVIIIIIQKEAGGVPGWIPVVLMMLIVTMFSGGVCPVTYIILTEMFNFQVSILFNANTINHITSLMELSKHKIYRNM